MKKKFVFPEQFHIAYRLFYLTFLIIPLSVVVGSLVAFFLWLLDIVTITRWANPWLVFVLPFGGLLITFLYKSYGKGTEAGNNLIMDEIHIPGGGIPIRMTPLVLITTLITHLFGGSAGREGTAVQMGGSISYLFSGWYKLEHKDRRVLLMCGMAAGFGSVFGTPVAGAIFAMEVLAIGTIRYDALIPCLTASILADITCAAYGIHHTHYQISFIPSTTGWLSFIHTDLLLLLKATGAGVAFGLTSFFFARLSHGIKHAATKYIKNPWLIPVSGGIAVIGISWLLGTFDYLGLGVTNPGHGTSIISSFAPGGVTHASWFWKLLLTAITLSMGFKGGEVTPLFFIGAALGNVIASISGAPVDLFAGLGFIAVFAGATNTPLACTIMGVELFGSANVLYFAITCFTAYYFSGQAGIYTAQKTAVAKFPVTDPDDKTSEPTDVLLKKGHA